MDTFLLFFIKLLFSACLLCALSNATMDTFLANLLLHATAQTSILKNALITLGKAKNRDHGGDLKECVKHYAAINK